MPSIHELPFLAPIPRGHQILVATFTFDDRSPTLVLDRTASTLYCPDTLWGPLRQDAVLAVSDPTAVLTRYAWTVRTAVEGVCAGALIETHQWGADRHQVKTLLLVEAPSGPYR